MKATDELNGRALSEYIVLQNNTKTPLKPQHYPNTTEQLLIELVNNTRRIAEAMESANEEGIRVWDQNNRI